jgi:cobaltochelatase CobS
MKLSEALNTLPAARYRNVLRQAVGERPDVPSNSAVESHLSSPHSLARFFKEPVVTYSALRDRLPTAILVALVVDEVTWGAVMAAFATPKSDCRKGASSYYFGWPITCTISTASTVMRYAKSGHYDAHAAKNYRVFAHTPITEKIMNLTDLSIDDIYETLVTLAATKLSILRTEAEADGMDLDAHTTTKLVHDAKMIAYGLMLKHFGKEKAEAAFELLKVDSTDLTTYAGTENPNAAFAVRKIVAEDGEAFRIDTKEGGAPAEEVVLTVKPEMKGLLDLALSQATSGAFASTDALIEKVRLASSGAVKKDEEIGRLKRLLAAKPVISLRSPVVTSSGGATLPSGTVITVKAADVFLSPDGKKSRLLNFDVPAFDWGGTDHPYVPAIDKNYIFRPATLLKFLWALNTNKKIWLHGHTGCGKTAFVEQVCARLNWPFFRVNLDSEITRMDMIGRDTLSGDGKGATISKFVDGILPQAMTLQGHGGILCVDEVSFGRPDVMYVFQRVLEDKGLLMNEDGGRLVHPGDMFRVVATDNTRGQGDEFGAYQGARPQSAAFLDRFTCWIEFDYLNAKEEARLLTNAVNGLVNSDAEQVANFATEVRTAFKTGSIYQTISPRGSMALAEAYLHFTTILDGDRLAAIKMASEAAILSKASDNDKQVIKGLFDRCFK